MDNSQNNPIDNPPQQENKKENGNQLGKTVLKFTRFQIVLVILQLIAVCIDAMSHGMMIMEFIAFMLLALPFVVSIIIEAIIITVNKITSRTSSVGMQNPSSANVQDDDNNSGSMISDQKHQAKHLNSPKKAFITLFSLLGATILLAVSNMFIPKYFAISDAFSKEEEALSSGSYSVKIIERELSGSGYNHHIGQTISVS